MGFAARRCAAIVERAREDEAIDKSRIDGVDILPPPREGSVELGGQMVARVRFRLSDGTSVTHDAWCVGVGSPDNRACTDDPQLILSGGVDHDVPCAGEAPGGNPNGCATLPPTPPPAAIAAALPLRVPALDIPLDHIGQYDIKVGGAGLPNGYLTRRDFSITDTSPTDFWVQGGIWLDVRPTVAGRPPVGSVYREPFDGTEPVDVFLVFEVTETSPGAVLRVRNLVVE
jgi:hypothetical protein